MPNIGPMEIIVVLIIALDRLRAEKPAELGKSLGKGIREFKGSISGEKSDADEQDAIEPAAVVVTPAAASKTPVTAEQHA